MNPKIAQTIEMLKLIQGMDYFSVEEQEQIARHLLEKTIEHTPQYAIAPLLQNPSVESILQLEEEDQTLLVRGLLLNPISQPFLLDGGRLLGALFRVHLSITCLVVLDCSEHGLYCTWFKN